MSANSSTIGIVQCKEQALAEWDKQLNRAYKMLMAKLNPQDQVLLRESQRAWLAYRAKEEKWLMKYYWGRGGSYWGLVITDRKMNIVRTRALEIVHYYKEVFDQEGAYNLP